MRSVLPGREVASRGRRIQWLAQKPYQTRVRAAIRCQRKPFTNTVAWRSEDVLHDACYRRIGVPGCANITQSIGAATTRAALILRWV